MVLLGVAPRCAIASTPIAAPLTTTMPLFASACASLNVKSFV